jgi:hypothetical protein
MKYSANYIRQGRGSYMVTSEAVASMALGNMRDRIKEAQAAADKGGAQQPSGKNDETSKALAQIEKLREQLQRASQGQRGSQQADGQRSGQRGQPGQQAQEGQQQGQGQEGQQSQSGQAGQQGQGQQAGQQQGQGGPQGGQSARGDSYGGDRAGGSLNRGDLPGAGTDAPLNRGDNVERTVRETIRDLSQLRQAMGGGNSEIGREISDFLRDLQRVDPSSYALAGPALADRINKEVLPAMEQLELQLRRKLDSENGGVVRNSSAERVPPGYSEKVAEYFRRLSSGKK